MCIRIEDDGVGFSPETVEKGNGLHNMRKRMEDIGGTFGLESAAGSGTNIRICVPDPNSET